VTAVRADPPESVLGVDVFLMSDGFYYLREDVEAARERDSPDAAAPMLQEHRILYRNLLAAALEHPTPCRGDARFTAEPETLTNSDTDEMRQTCDSCHASARCAIYARYGQPPTGFWAGKDRSPRTRAQLREAALPRAMRSPDRHAPTHQERHER
jgi:hypothetical protein